MSDCETAQREPETVVTPEMIAAGRAEYDRHDLRFDSLLDVLLEVYRAMAHKGRP
jgi:hypothetical protein